MPRREELDRDLRAYLAARRRKTFSFREFFSGLFPKPRFERVEMPEKIEVYDAGEKPAVVKTGVEIVEECEPRPGFLAKLFGTKEEAKPDEALVQAKLEAEEAITDMKELAKISLTAIKQLPDEKLHEFKKGADFEKLKEILKKHSLIK